MKRAKRRLRRYRPGWWAQMPEPKVAPWMAPLYAEFIAAAGLPPHVPEWKPVRQWIDPRVAP